MTRRAWILMGLLAAVWGASYLFIKVALNDGLDPIFIVFSRLALGALVLVPIALHAGALSWVRGREGPVLVLAVVQIVIPFLLITYGEQYIASSLTGILVSAAPIWTALIAVRVDQEERPRGIALAGVLVGIVGVVLLFGVDLSGEAKAVAGGLMVLLAALGYAIGALYLKHRLKGNPPVGIAAATMLASALLLLPAAPFVVPAQAPSFEAVGSLLLLGAGGTGLAFLIFYTLISDVGPSRAAVVAYIAPAWAVGYGVVLLDEPLTAGAILGLVLILGGSWLAAEGRMPWQRRVVPVTPLDPVAERPVRRAAA